MNYYLRENSLMKLSRRNFIKAIGVGSLALFTPYILFPSTMAMAFEDDEITFAKAYPVPFYEKDWFEPLIMLASFIGTVAVLYFTAGAGAPAAAPGVSTIASWIAGGGPGSYMAGLSIVGSLFGGNAILGAAILNAASLTLIGGAGAKGSLVLGAKIARLTDLTIIGVEIMKSTGESSSNGGFIFNIPIPFNWGSKNVKENILEPLNEISGKILDLQEDLIELHQDKCEAVKEGDTIKVKEILKEIKNKEEMIKHLNKEKQKLVNLSNLTLEKLIYHIESQSKKIHNRSQVGEDLLVLGVIANNSGNVELFSKSLYILNSLASTARKTSFLDYLNGILFLQEGEFKIAEKYLYKSLNQEPYVVETAIALISALSQNYVKNKSEIEKVVRTVEEEYDDDNYKGKNLRILYYHTGTVAMVNGDYQSALKYFKKAYDSLGIIKYLPLPFDSVKRAKNFFQMPIAVTYKLLGSEKLGKDILEEILERCENLPCKEECRKKYLIWYEQANKIM